jgi:hypothetical protein
LGLLGLAKEEVGLFGDNSSLEANQMDSECYFCPISLSII